VVRTAEQAQVEVLQHTPVHGEAHVPPQVKIFGDGQSAGVVTKQTPVVLAQHLPVQGLGEQEPLQ
jgi:hypothetical protein